MKLNITQTMAGTSLLEKGAFVVSGNAKAMAGGIAKEAKEKLQQETKSNSMDQDTSVAVRKTKTAIAPVTTVATGVVINHIYAQKMEAFNQKYDAANAAKIVEVFKSNNVHVNAMSHDKMITDNFGSTTINLQELKTVFKDDYIPGQFHMSDQKITIFDPDKVRDINKAAGLTYSRLSTKSMGSGLSAIQKKDLELMRQLRTDSKKLMKLSQKAKHFKSPKAILRPITRISTSELSQSEVMQGYRIGMGCRSAGKLAFKGSVKTANITAFNIEKLMQKRFYMKYKGSLAQKADAKRFANQVMRKKYGSAQNFFKTKINKSTLKLATDLLKNSKSAIGRSSYELLTQLQGKDLSKTSIKTMMKANARNAFGKTRTKKVLDKGLTPFKLLKNKLENTKVARLFKKINKSKNNFMQSVAKLVSKFFSVVLSALGSFAGTIMAMIGPIIPFIIIIMMIVSLVLSIFHVAVDNKKAQGTWTNTIVTTKEAIANMATSSGLDATNAYSQTEYLLINIDNVEKSVRRDCSGYVSACLTFYGSFNTDQTWSSANFCDYPTIRGFDKLYTKDMDYTKDFQKGDIICKSGHVEIFDSYDENNSAKYNAYTNGSDKSVINPETTSKARSGLSKYTVIWRNNGELEKPAADDTEIDDTEVNDTEMDNAEADISADDL